jgi:hypothetical protein
MIETEILMRPEAISARQKMRASPRHPPRGCEKVAHNFDRPLAGSYWAA